MKYIVVCMDGTGNSPVSVDDLSVREIEAQNIEEKIKTEHSSVAVSNVYRFWRLLIGDPQRTYAPHKLIGADEYRYYGLIGNVYLGVNHEVEGEALYLNGVGVQGGGFIKSFTGATGTGISLRIKDAYRFIAERYEEGAKIIISGFSRGAYAARSLAGFIEKVGLPSEKRLLPSKAVDELYDYYRNERVQEDAEPFLKLMRRDVVVDSLILWDTVGSLALPERNSFHNINPKNVRHVRHALALDEKRMHFRPEYWAGKEIGSRKEVWFAGAHSNVGGGYQSAALSNVSFIWMLRELSDIYKVAVDLQMLEEYAEEEGKPRTIRNSFGEFYQGLLSIAKLMKPYGEVRIIDHGKGQTFHPSVYQWMTQKDSLYRPYAKLNAGDLSAQYVMENLEENVLDWPLD